MFVCVLVTCSPGFYQGQPAIVVTDLGNGQYINEAMPQCLECPIGHYQSEKGATQCTSCGEYTATDITGSKSSSDCIGT